MPDDKDDVAFPGAMLVTKEVDVPHGDFVPMAFGPYTMSPKMREAWEKFLASLPPDRHFYCDTDSEITAPERRVSERVERDGSHALAVVDFTPGPPALYVDAPEWSASFGGVPQRFQGAIHDASGSYFTLECGHRYHVTNENSLRPGTCWPSFKDVVPCPLCLMGKISRGP